MKKSFLKKITKKLTSICIAAAMALGVISISDTKLDVKAAFDAPYYNLDINGGYWGGTYYELNHQIIKDAFFCDGYFTYYMQMDGTAMRDRLTYHPDGEHVIYFDEKGHEVFNSFVNVRKSIAGEDVNDFCFFDVHGYMYTNVLTYNQDGTALYYANPYGVMERSGWFQFAEGAGGVAGALGITEGTWGYAYSDGRVDPESIGDESVKNSFKPNYTHQHIWENVGHTEPRYYRVDTGEDVTDGQIVAVDGQLCIITGYIGGYQCLVCGTKVNSAQEIDDHVWGTHNGEANYGTWQEPIYVAVTQKSIYVEDYQRCISCGTRK